jgi:hypothetical protein
MFEALLALQFKEYRKMHKESDKFKATEKPIT